MLVLPIHPKNKLSQKDAKTFLAILSCHRVFSRQFAPVFSLTGRTGPQTAGGIVFGSNADRESNLPQFEHVLFYRTSKASTLFRSEALCDKEELRRNAKISEGYLEEPGSGKI